MGSPIKLLIVIPTRNRADLAEASIRSVLNQMQDNCSLLVSDNSTDENEAKRLARFCDGLKGQLRYVRPTESLPMSKHWQWALEQGTSHGEPTHVTYVTDRELLKKGELSRLLQLVSRNPDKLISFNLDSIIDFETPIKVDQAGWSGKLLEVESKDLLNWYSYAQWHPALPRMMNSIAPITHLNEVAGRFGSVFDSFSPDICFGFRYLSLKKSFLYFDKAPIFHYELGRSNGASHGRGVATKDAVDFVANVSVDPVKLKTPVPEFPTVMNWILHEYTCVKDEVGSGFPEINLPAYFSVIARERDRIEDAKLRQEITEVLTTSAASRKVDLTKPIDKPDAPSVPELISHRYTEFDSQRAAIKFAEDNQRPRGTQRTMGELANAVRTRLILRTRIKKLLSHSERSNRAES
jgi:glycosyltransferase involved in cell wall biosynthesis